MSQPSTATAGWITSTPHYENFPVASVLVPAALRPDIAAVYRFARHADDVADEGQAPAEQRLAELQRLREGFERAGGHPLTDALAPVIARHRLSTRPFLDLLSAFEQDARGPEFADRAALLDYCRRSADPIGRIVLGIFGVQERADLARSDAVCSALQLINFVQDIGQDVTRGRLYVPADELAHAGLGESDLLEAAARRSITPQIRRLLETQAQAAEELLARGPGLLPALPLRLRLELAAVIAGGHRMLERARREDPFATRLKLGRADLPRIAATGVRIALLGRLR